MSLTVEVDTSIDSDLSTTVLEILQKHSTRDRLAEAERVGWSQDLWDEFAGYGFARVGIPEGVNGSGGRSIDAAEIVRLSGYTAAPIPAAETLLIAGPALAQAGIDVPDAAIAAIPEPGDLRATKTENSWKMNGRAENVPWARTSEFAVGIVPSDDGPVLVLVAIDDLQIEPGRNYAGEPRDTIIADDVAVIAGAHATEHGVSQESWLLSGALARSLQIAGAVERILELSVDHARTRVQFTKPIARFQAVGQLVTLLGEAAAQARMAGEMAVQSGRVEDALIAKIIAGEAASTGSAQAHQIHGAMGTTLEGDLQWFTRRLWSWRAEFGSERRWARQLGSQVLQENTKQLWSLITAHSIHEKGSE